ncbi:MAG: penicillin-binding protein activator [Methylococcales bacterium]|nr:penicillin-binding protein activator [Methylococcales bacterium]
MKHHYLLYLSFCLILLTGCSTKTVQGQSNNAHKATQAGSFMRSGQHKKAAHLFQTLALSEPKQQEQYNFLAAEALIQSGDNQTAQKLLSRIKPASLSSKQRNKLHLFSAQIYLSRGDAHQALSDLKLTQAYNLQNKDKITYYQSLAFAYSLTGKQLSSAQARTQLSPLLSNDEERQNNNTVIFSTLNALPLSTLTSNESTSSGTFRGWIALARIFKADQSHQNNSNIQANLIEWKQLYSDHPANSGFLDSYLKESPVVIKQPSSIAFLLPESGRFALAARVIKEGFMAAYNLNQSGFQPALLFYDSSINNTADLYHQAISDGAELIIGPLSKDNIKTLAADSELTIPVLALNHVPHLFKNNLFQFGLSPIDETKQIATRAFIKGNKNVLLITPETTQGNRAADSLTEYWQEIGGTVIESQYYNAKDNDFSVSIKELLNLNESKDRYKRLKHFLATDIEHKPRVRQDADAIFLSAFPKKARSIYPQLQFYGATKIPVYAVNQLYSGIHNPMLDRDLNKVIFCDIPWLSPQTYTGNLSQQSLQEIWKNFPIKYLRLMALGIDSLSLIGRLNQISITPYEGATGKLSLNHENRITRQLVCAKFEKGGIQLLSPAYEQNITPEEPESFNFQQFLD